MLSPIREQNAVRAQLMADDATAHFDNPDTANKLWVPGGIGNNALGTGNPLDTSAASLTEAFPDVAPGLEPLGTLILLQLRCVPDMTRGGLMLTSEARRTEQDNTQVAKVVAVGPIAFCDRRTGEKYPEGDWVVSGDYVRIPKYGGDRWDVTYTRTREVPGRPPEEIKDIVTFLLLRDLALLGKIVGNPLEVRAHY